MSAPSHPGAAPASHPTPAAEPPRRRISDLPGPRGIPWLGVALQVNPIKFHQDVERWARQHGPFYCVKLAAQRFLVVSDPEAINTVLRDRPTGFRRWQVAADVAREILGWDGLFFAEGESWERQRRMVMSAFSPGQVRNYFPALHKVVLRLQGRWQTAACAGTPVALQADLMRYTVDGVAGLSFGIDVNTLESEGDVIQHHLDKVFPLMQKRILSPLPLWRYVKLPADRELDRSVAIVNQAIESFITQARHRLKVEPSRREQPQNLIEAMLVAADQHGSGITEQDVLGNVWTMLLAGEDTTANTLAWMVHLLHRHPEALRRAREEVLRLAPDPSRYTPEAIAGLAYVEACAHEALRLRPVAPFFALEALRDTVLQGVEVPTGTQLLLVMRNHSTDPQHVARGDAFDPDRWLASEGGATDSPSGPIHTPSGLKRVSTPFGAGPRVCPGRYLALLEIKMAMAMLLSCFDIDSVQTPGGGEPDEELKFAMAPSALEMRISQRPAMQAVSILREA
jgi:cytochrome P450